jgi:hypothetical protein
MLWRVMSCHVGNASPPAPPLTDFCIVAAAAKSATLPLSSSVEPKEKCVSPSLAAAGMPVLRGSGSVGDANEAADSLLLSRGSGLSW